MSFKDGAELSEAAKKAVEAARSQIRSFLTDDHSIRPSFLRLAFYDAILQNPIGHAGELKRSIHLSSNEAELVPELKLAMTKLDNVKKSQPLISYADLFQLAGIESIKHLTQKDIAFQYGRPDFCVPVPKDDIALFSRMEKGEDVANVKAIFNQLGFSDKEIVALYSAFIYSTDTSLFRETSSAGQVNLWDAYKLILMNETKPKEGSNVEASSSTDQNKQQSTIFNPTKATSSENPNQFDKTSSTKVTSSQTTASNTPKSSSEPLIAQPSATKSSRTWNFLLSNSSFRKHVENFAANPQQLSDTYLAAHKKLSELGFQPFAKLGPLIETKEYHDIQHGVAFAVVMTIIVGVMGFFYETMRS